MKESEKLGSVEAIILVHLIRLTSFNLRGQLNTQESLLIYTESVHEAAVNYALVPEAPVI